MYWPISKEWSSNWLIKKNKRSYDKNNKKQKLNKNKKKIKNWKINIVIMIRTFIISLALTSKLIVLINKKLCCFRNTCKDYKCEWLADFSQSRLSNLRAQTLTHVSSFGLSIALAGYTCHGWLPLRLVSRGKARYNVW